MNNTLSFISGIVVGVAGTLIGIIVVADIAESYHQWQLKKLWARSTEKAKQASETVETNKGEDI